MRKVAEIARWVRVDGSRLVLHADRTLTEAVGASGKMQLFRSNVTDRIVRSYVKRRGYRQLFWRGHEQGLRKRRSPVRPGRRKADPPTVPRTAEPNVSLTSDQQEQVDAWIAWHKLRVHLEEVRLRDSVLRAQGKRS